MNATEQRQIKSALDRIVERTPDLGPTPDDLLLRQPEPRSNWRPLIAVAAATVVLVGVGVLAANRPTPADNAAEPATQSEQTESSQAAPDVAATDTVLLAPAALPDGYVLYSASNRVDTNPLEGNAEHIFGPPDARPDQIVEVGAGTDVEGIPCGSAAAPITISNEPQFCTDRPVAAKQLRWNIGEVAIVIWGGSSVADETLLELAAAVSINPAVTPGTQPPADDTNQGSASGAWLDDSQLIISPLPDPTWIRLGHQDPEPLTSDSYLIGSATEWDAPSFLVDVYTDTNGTDIWSVMDKRHNSVEINLRGTTAYLDDTDDNNPFLVWQEQPGIIIRIQNNGGTADAIVAFAESLTPLDADGRAAFLATAQTPPPAPPTPSEGVASTIPNPGN
jgi:hypothetical protein